MSSVTPSNASAFGGLCWLFNNFVIKFIAVRARGAKTRRPGQQMSQTPQTLSSFGNVDTRAQSHYPSALAVCVGLRVFHLANAAAFK